ncbi:hypothetical protein CPC08DRAFT_463834 [Agrocybe pediades]|nr:hypothetical protein CPC08DRAFT_463834 [Agrocybe pediades]
MIDNAMEDLQMEWPNLFSMHVPGSENRLYFAREYLLKYHSRSASKIRIQKQQSEVKVPLHQPGRKKFKSSLGSSALTPSTQSAPPGLDRVASTKIVESSIPQESTPEPVSTPTPSYSACQLSPFIMPLHEPPSTQSFNSSPVTSPPASYGMGQSFCSFSASSQTPRFEPSLADAVPSKALPAGRASTLVECTRIAVESAPDTLDRQSPPSITPTSEPPLTPSLSTSVGFATPAAYGIDQNVFSFLRSCQPSLTHLAAVFADVGCSTHQHLFAMSCFPRTEERRYLLLKDVFKGRGVTEMESMIIERQLDFVGWIPV